MSDYKEKKEKTFKKIKGTLIGLVGVFSAFLFTFGLIMVIYQYDTNTIVFGILLLVISVVALISDIFIIKFWKSGSFVNAKYDNEVSSKISEFEKEIEDIKKRNNIK